MLRPICSLVLLTKDSPLEFASAWLPHNRIIINNRERIDNQQKTLEEEQEKQRKVVRL